MAGRPLDTRLRVAGWLRLAAPLHVGGLSLNADVDLTVAVDGQSRLYVPGTSLAGALRSWLGGADDADADGADFTESSPLALWGYAQTPRSRPGGADDPTDGPGAAPVGAEGAARRRQRIRAPEARASRIIVRDALVCATRPADPAAPPADENLLPPARLEVRTSVGIDRFSATAADRVLYSRAVVPAGAYLRLEIDVECGADPDVRKLDRTRLGALLDALMAGDLRLGAAVSRGLGKIILDEDVRIVEHDLTSRAGLLAVLRDPGGANGRPGSVRRELADLRGAGGHDSVAELLTVTIAWTPRAPVIVRADRAGLVADTVPLTSAGGGPGDAGKVRLILPGSSLKGAWRTHAERILRTTAPAPCTPPVLASNTTAPEELHAQLRDDCLRPVWALFGEPPRTARPADEGPPPGRADVDRVPWGRGALRVEDAVSRRALDASEWGLLVRGEPLSPQGAGGVPGGGPPAGGRNGRGRHAGSRSAGSVSAGSRDADGSDIAASPGEGSRLTDEQLRWLDGAGMARADHVAIDRWTGGAADKLLFSVLEPWRVAWSPLTLILDITRLRLLDDRSAAADPKDAAPPWQVGVVLLLLLLRDLAAGRLPLGGMVNRGFGDVTVEHITLRWTGGSTGEPGRPDGEVTLADLLASGLGAELVDAWRTYHRTQKEVAV